ncbi:MAG TPA: histidine phosphatase family protein [Micromonosporaceae bacterium]|nr:histidine phosphatase family protein [Micromonosporaceae bacterium]
MTRLVLWRHGQTEWNITDRVQGQTDIELTDIGTAQAEAAAPRLAAFRPDAIVSSDLRRAVQTANALAALTELPVETDPRLRERFFGEWQGLAIPDIARRWPAEYARWRAGDAGPGCGIEHRDELAKRAGSALRDIADRFDGRTVVIATHGGSAREGIAALLGWPAEVSRTLGGLGNCHWTVLRLNAVRGWQLRAYNIGA